MTSILRIERSAYTTGSNSYKERFRIKLDCFPTKIGILFRISYFLENLMTSDLFFLSAATGKGSRGDLRLNRAMEIMKEKGSLSNRIRIRASVKVKDSAFTPEMFVRVHLPIPAACDQQSDIRIESVFPENAKIAPEDAPQRTICWEETLKENHEFSVQYSYVHTAVWHDTESALKKSDACKTFGTEVNPGTVSQEQTLSAGLNHKAAETVQLYAHSSNESSS